MDSYYFENSSDNLLTLLAGLNELIRNSYITGFKDGQEFQLKISKEEANSPVNDRVSDLFNKYNSKSVKMLTEDEQILGECS